jgi:hypothetical protein
MNLHNTKINQNAFKLLNINKIRKYKSINSCFNKELLFDNCLHFFVKTRYFVNLNSLQCSFAGDFGAGSLEYRAIVGGIRPYGANSWGSFIS